MATRFYLPASGSAPATPAYDANWERQFTGWTRRPLVRSKSNTALATLSETFGATATQQKLYAQWISETLDVDQTISGTVSMVVGKCAETTTSGDAHLAFSLRVLKPDNTFRGTLLLYHATSTEFPLIASAATRIHSARAITSLACLAGDRLVLEIGIHAVTPANEVMQMRFGDPSATADFALTAGLTTDLDPWMELSATLTFGTPAINLSGVGNIASGEAHGSPVLSLDLSAAGAIASLEAFGTPTVSTPSPPHEVTGAGAIASAEAHGIPSLALTASPQAIASEEACGVPALSVAISASSISSAEALGGPVLSASLALPGIASGEAIGEPTLAALLSALGIPSSEALGEPTVSLGPVDVNLSGVGGIVSAEAHGIPSLVLALSAPGIPSVEAFGGPAVGLGVHPAGIASAEAFGLPAVTPASGDIDLVLQGIPSAEAFGTPILCRPPRHYIQSSKSGPQFL